MFHSLIGSCLCLYTYICICVYKFIYIYREIYVYLHRIATYKCFLDSYAQLPMEVCRCHLPTHEATRDDSCPKLVTPNMGAKLTKGPVS